MVADSAVALAPGRGDDELDLSEFQGLLDGVSLDSSEHRKSFVVVAPNGVHVKIARSAYLILNGLALGEEPRRLAERLNRAEGWSLTEAEIDSARRLLGRKLRAIASKPNELPSFFWLRFPLLSSELVRRLARKLVFLYRTPTLPVALFGVAAGFAAASVARLPVDPGGQSSVSAFALFVLSVLVHELGHATAVARFGREPGGIGFTVYLIYPAFYSDVTAAWVLSRGRRVVVDLGGAYFQAIVGSLYVALYLWTEWTPFLGAFSLILLGLLFSLNPIFRFDGYWVISDALGVTNLGRVPGTILRRWWRRCTGRAVEPAPWPGLVVLALSLYTLLTICVWSFFVVLLLPSLTAQIALLPELSGQMWSPSSPADAIRWGAVRSMVVTLMMLVFVGLMLWRVVRTVATPLARAVRGVSRAS